MSSEEIFREAMKEKEKEQEVVSHRILDRPAKTTSIDQVIRDMIELHASNKAKTQAKQMSQDDNQNEEGPVFTLFPQLPIELRLKIWKLHLPGPRIVRLFCDEIPRAGLYDLRCTSIPIANVCHESREVVEASYSTLSINPLDQSERLPHRRRARSRGYIDYQRDTVLIQGDSVALRRAATNLNILNVEHIALATKLLDAGTDMLLEEIRNTFPNLRTLVISLGEWRYPSSYTEEALFVEIDSNFDDLVDSWKPERVSHVGRPITEPAQYLMEAEVINGWFQSCVYERPDKWGGIKLTCAVMARKQSGKRGWIIRYSEEPHRDLDWYIPVEDSELMVCRRVCDDDRSLLSRYDGIRRMFEEPALATPETAKDIFDDSALTIPETTEDIFKEPALPTPETARGTNIWRNLLAALSGLSTS